MLVIQVPFDLGDEHFLSVMVKTDKVRHSNPALERNADCVILYELPL